VFVVLVFKLYLVVLCFVCGVVCLDVCLDVLCVRCVCCVCYRHLALHQAVFNVALVVFASYHYQTMPFCGEKWCVCVCV